MIPTDVPFQFKRLQFPIKVSLTILINKAQDLTFNMLVLICALIVSHMDSSMWLSRKYKPENQFTIIPIIPDGLKIKNIIYFEVL